MRCKVLTSCHFPGNVRELENCIRRTATLANADRLVADDFACRQDECLSAVLWRKPADSTDGFVPLPIGRGASYGKPPPPAPPATAGAQNRATAPAAERAPGRIGAADEPETDRERWSRPWKPPAGSRPRRHAFSD